VKRIICLGAALLFCTAASAFGEDLSERVNQLENAVRSQARTIEEQQKTIDELKEKKTQAIPAESGATGAQPPAQELQQKVNELNDKVEQVVEAQKKEIPGIFNPAIGLVGETIFSYRGKGSDKTGSDRPGGWDVFQRSVELNVTGSVDPFATGYAVINASADPVTGEASLGVEEAALQTTSLPGNLTLKAGRFFGEFGRLGYIHDHELPFVFRPLVLAQYIGGESRTDGLQLNWLLPTERYLSLTVGSGVQFGGDNPPNDPGTFRNGSGLNYWGRLSSYFELTPDISFEPGISGLWNPHTDAQWRDAFNPVTNPTGANPAFPTDLAGNTFTERERRLTGLDLVLNYKPLQTNQFTGVTWGSELLYSDNRYDVSTPLGAALGNRTVQSLGLYSYLTCKISREWSAGFLYEWLENAVDRRDKTAAYSPYLTWATSHWNQIRLQFTHTDHNAASPLSSDNAVYVQWAWIIGAHSHGWQQR
jgi:hypothetical protein